MESSSKSHPTLPLPPKNAAVGSVDIRDLFKLKMAQVSATSTAASSSTSSAVNNPDSRQTTATIIDLRVTDNTSAASSTASMTEESRMISDPRSTQLIEQARRPQDESMAKIVEDRKQCESSEATAATLDIPVEITK